MAWWSLRMVRRLHWQDEVGVSARLECLVRGYVELIKRY